MKFSSVKMWDIYGNFIQLLNECAFAKVLITSSHRVFSLSGPVPFTLPVYVYVVYVYTYVQWSPWS